MNAGKVYKDGETVVNCIVLDIDSEKKIVDLSERLYSAEESKQKKAKKGEEGNSYQKAVVELNKEQYLVVSLKSDRTSIGVCLL